MKPDLEYMLNREAAREGIPKSRILERALRAELNAPLAGLVRVFIDPRQARELEAAAARMGHKAPELIEALIRTYLPKLTEDQVDPKARAEAAALRARQLLA